MILAFCLAQIFANSDFELSFLSDEQRRNLETIDLNKLTDNIQNVLRKARTNPNE